MHTPNALPDSREKRAENRKIRDDFNALVIKAVKGDRFALYNLCEKLAEDVLYRTKYILGNEADAEDVSQEVMLRICENIQTVREPRAFRAWLSGIILIEARRHLIKKTKRGKILRIEDFKAAPAKEGSENLPGGRIEESNIRHAVMESVSTLPYRQREAVVLHYYDDLNVDDVAYAMNIPYQSVTKFLALARKKIMLDLADKNYVQSMSSLTAMPMGSFISEALHAGAAEFIPSNIVWFNGVLAQCHRHILSNAFDYGSAAAKAAGIAPMADRVSFGVLLGSLTALVIAAVIALGVILNGAVFMTSGSAASSQQTALEARISFAGEPDYIEFERVA